MDYRIGDFSLLTRLTVKTLHFYHQEGLLVPQRVDPATGYRWYAEAQVHRAGLISFLKTAGFTLGEIKAILAECHDDADLEGFIDRKSLELDRRIRELRQVRTGLDRLRDQLRQDETASGLAAGLAPDRAAGAPTVATRGAETLPAGVALVDRPELSYVSVRFTGAYQDVGGHFAALYRQARSQVAGPGFCLYHQLEHREDDADIEVALPVVAGARGLETRVLPAGRWLETTHVGAYAELGRAYGRLLWAAAAQGLSLVPPVRECYLKGPGWFFPGRPEHYRTLVAIAVGP